MWYELFLPLGKKKKISEFCIRKDNVSLDYNILDISMFNDFGSDNVKCERP